MPFRVGLQLRPFIFPQGRCGTLTTSHPKLRAGGGFVLSIPCGVNPGPLLYTFTHIFKSLFFAMSVTRQLSKYTLQWDSYGHELNDDDIGGIYTDYIHFDSVADYHFAVSFRVGEGRQLGILFSEVVITTPEKWVEKRHYAFGEFMTNKGAKLFAQFALNRFIESEKWDVCPSFEPVEYTDGDPYTLGGDEIVSTLI